jgi:DNA-binding MarR family transcriptional regulator
MKLEEEIFQKSFRNNKHKAVVNIIYTYNWLYSRQYDLLKPYGLTIQQYNILRILKGQHPNPASIKLLKERMLDKMSDASRLVEKLRTKGLVERKECPKDRRNVDILITEEGLKLLRTLEKKINEFDNLLSNLEEEEINRLNILLDKMRD